MPTAPGLWLSPHRYRLLFGPPLASQLSAWAQPLSPGLDPATALRAVLIWSRLHGFVTLEIAGNFASMGIDPDQLFEIQLPTLW